MGITRARGILLQKGVQIPQISRCRICNSEGLHQFLELGSTPLANSFVKPGHSTDPEASYPLNVLLCGKCGLVQLGYAVPPEILFKDYIYFSSTSDLMKKHFAELAEEVLRKFSKPGDLVVEVASNDGVLLKNMLNRGVRPLGIEPAANIAEVANKAGVETVCDFFSSRSAAEVKAKKGAAAAILANNVFAHVADLHDFVEGMKVLLGNGGVAIIEFPYLVDFFRNREFDTVYHEHLAYLSLKPVMHLFGRHGMEVFDARLVPVHGGSIRVYVQHAGGPKQRNSAALDQLLEAEGRMGLADPATYAHFASGVMDLRVKLLTLLTDLKKKGKRIAIYGVPAKGNTLLNYCRIGADIIDYAVDKSPYKQGLLTPGMHIPVYGPERLAKERPDYLLILAWNFAEEIMQQQEEYRKAGGKFIIPIPEPRII